MPPNSLAKEPKGWMGLQSSWPACSKCISRLQSPSTVAPQRFGGLRVSRAGAGLRRATSDGCCTLRTGIWGDSFRNLQLTSMSPASGFHVKLFTKLFRATGSSEGSLGACWFGSAGADTDLNYDGTCDSACDKRHGRPASSWNVSLRGSSYSLPQLQESHHGVRIDLQLPCSRPYLSSPHVPGPPFASTLLSPWYDDVGS